MGRNGFCVVAFSATAMGIVLPGCLWSEDKSLGRICASPAQGADAEKDPLLATFALDKEAIKAIQKVLDGAKGDLEPLAKQYADVVKAFSAYRESEATEKTEYQSFAKDASNAPIEDLDSIEQAILKAGQDASAKPNDLIMDALKLSADLHQFALSSQASLEPHADFLSTHVATSPDMTSGALRSLDAMLGYIDKRVARSDATAKVLIIGVGMRRKALELGVTCPVMLRRVGR